MGGEVKTESPALGILLLCDLTHQITSHKMKENSFGEKKNILRSQRAYKSPLCSLYFEVNYTFLEIQISLHTKDRFNREQDDDCSCPWQDKKLPSAVLLGPC